MMGDFESNFPHPNDDRPTYDLADHYDEIPTSFAPDIPMKMPPLNRDEGE